MKVAVKYKEGKVYIEHNNVNIKAFHVRYNFINKKGSININLPTNWLYSSNQNNIVMVNMGNTYLEDGYCIFKYEGLIEINEIDIVSDELQFKTIKKCTNFINNNSSVVKPDDSSIGNLAFETFGNETAIGDYSDKINYEGSIGGNKQDNVELYRKMYFNKNKLDYKKQTKGNKLSKNLIKTIQNLRGNY